MYVRLCEGLVTKGRLISSKTNLNKLIENTDKDLYVSAFQYTPDQYEKFKKAGTIAGIKEVTTDKLYWDLDSGDVQKARIDAIELCARLQNMGVSPENIFIAFSGQKGFDVTVYTEYNFRPDEVRKICAKLATDLESFDNSMYDAPQIFRVTGTKHPKTGLFKSQLTLEQLRSMSVAEIQEYSKQRRLPGQVGEASIDQQKLEDILKEPEKTRSTLSKIKIDNCPSWLTECKYHLQQGNYPAGKGNEGRMILAATYKAQGFDADLVRNMLLEIERKRVENNLTEEIISESDLDREVIDVVFSEQWEGGQYTCQKPGFLQEYCQDHGFDCHNNKVNEVSSSVVSISDIKKRFIAFAQNYEKNRIMTGITELDDELVLLTGMMVGILGAPSSGKTTIANNIVENLSVNANDVYYGSHDMYDNLLYARLLQKYCGYDIKIILDMIKNDRPNAKLRHAMDEVEKNYHNVAFDFQTGPTIEEIEHRLVEHEKTTGKKVKLMVVDYLEKIQTKFSDATASSAYAASKLSDIAKKHDLCLIVLLQPQKMAGDPSAELNSMRNVKGSSVIEQDCRVVLSVSRPGFNTRDSSNDEYVTLNILKNNMGGLGSFDLHWSGISGKIRTLTHEEAMELKTLRELTKEEIEASKPKFGF